MINIDVKNDIGNERDISFFFFGENEPRLFSLASIKEAIESEPEDNDIRLNIHCCGGSVEEGLAIYDYLRCSGKNIYTNIEGACHSMATVLLLCAPLERRSAQPNASALIHKVSMCSCGEETIDSLEAKLSLLKTDTEKILNIYAERTGKDKEELRGLMNQQKERTVQELLAWGFIGSVNAYNTNKKETIKQIDNKQTKSMQKTLKQLDEMITNFKSKVKVIITGSQNYDFPNAEGGVLFSTPKEDDTMAVGDEASPEGTFELTEDTSEYKQGTVVVVKEGKIASITPKTDQSESPEEKRIAELEEENKKLKEQCGNLAKDVQSRNSLIEEGNGVIDTLKKQLVSSYTPKDRKPQTTIQTPQNGTGGKQKTQEEFKEELREKMNLKKKED